MTSQWVVAEGAGMSAHAMRPAIGTRRGNTSRANVWSSRGRSTFVGTMATGTVVGAVVVAVVVVENDEATPKMVYYTVLEKKNDSLQNQESLTLFFMFLFRLEQTRVFIGQLF